MSGKVPRRPPAPLTRTDDDIHHARPVLWRIHRTIGRHAAGWNQLRHYGPLPGMRYDPHPPPTREHERFAVAYTAPDIATAAAEMFQITRRIRAGRDLQLTAWSPTRHLALLDLTGSWALRNGAANALTAAPRPTCRAWAHAIANTWPDLDGLYAPSTLTGTPMIVLFAPARDSYPAAPAFSRPLDHPTIWAALARVADAIGYSIADATQG